MNYSWLRGQIIRHSSPAERTAMPLPGLLLDAQNVQITSIAQGVLAGQHHAVTLA
jgi:hypothetical protein